MVYSLLFMANFMSIVTLEDRRNQITLDIFYDLFCCISKQQNVICGPEKTEVGPAAPLLQTHHFRGNCVFSLALKFGAICEMYLTILRLVGYERGQVLNRT